MIPHTQRKEGELIRQQEKQRQALLDEKIERDRLERQRQDKNEEQERYLAAVEARKVLGECRVFICGCSFHLFCVASKTRDEQP